MACGRGFDSPRLHQDVIPRRLTPPKRPKSIDDLGFFLCPYACVGGQPRAAPCVTRFRRAAAAGRGAGSPLAALLSVRPQFPGAAGSVALADGASVRGCRLPATRLRRDGLLPRDLKRARFPASRRGGHAPRQGRHGHPAPARLHRHRPKRATCRRRWASAHRFANPDPARVRPRRGDGCATAGARHPRRCEDARSPSARWACPAHRRPAGPCGSRPGASPARCMSCAVDGGPGGCTCPVRRLAPGVSCPGGPDPRWRLGAGGPAASRADGHRDAPATDAVNVVDAVLRRLPASMARERGRLAGWRRR